MWFVNGQIRLDGKPPLMDITLIFFRFYIYIQLIVLLALIVNIDFEESFTI